MLFGVLSDLSMEEAGSLMISQLEINGIKLLNCLPGSCAQQEHGPFLSGCLVCRRGSK